MKRANWLRYIPTQRVSLLQDRGPCVVVRVLEVVQSKRLDFVCVCLPRGGLCESAMVVISVGCQLFGVLRNQERGRRTLR